MAAMVNLASLEACNWHDAVIESISINPSARVTSRGTDNPEGLPDLFVTIRLGGDNKRVQLVLRRCSCVHFEFGIDLDVAVVREKRGFRLLWHRGLPTVGTLCEAIEWTCSPIGALEA